MNISGSWLVSRYTASGDIVERLMTISPYEIATYDANGALTLRKSTGDVDQVSWDQGSKFLFRLCFQNGETYIFVSGFRDVVVHYLTACVRIRAQCDASNTPPPFVPNDETASYCNIKFNVHGVGANGHLHAHVLTLTRESILHHERQTGNRFSLHQYGDVVALLYGSEDQLNINIRYGNDNEYRFICDEEDRPLLLALLQARINYYKAVMRLQTGASANQPVGDLEDIALTQPSKTPLRRTKSAHVPHSGYIHQADVDMLTPSRDANGDRTGAGSPGGRSAPGSRYSTRRGRVSMHSHYGDGSRLDFAHPDLDNDSDTDTGSLEDGENSPPHQYGRAAPHRDPPRPPVHSSPGPGYQAPPPPPSSGNAARRSGNVMAAVAAFQGAARDGVQPQERGAPGTDDKRKSLTSRQALANLFRRSATPGSSPLPPPPPPGASDNPPSGVGLPPPPSDLQPEPPRTPTTPRFGDPPATPASARQDPFAVREAKKQTPSFASIVTQLQEQRGKGTPSAASPRLGAGGKDGLVMNAAQRWKQAVQQRHQERESTLNERQQSVRDLESRVAREKETIEEEKARLRNAQIELQKAQDRFKADVNEKKREQDMENMLVRFLIEGSVLAKYTHNGRGGPHDRYFTMNVSSAKVTWGVRQYQKKDLKTATVTGIIPGSSGVKTHGRVTLQEEQRTFTLITRDYRTNLILRARDKATYEKWYQGVQLVLARQQMGWRAPLSSVGIQFGSGQMQQSDGSPIPGSPSAIVASRSTSGTTPSAVHL